jgi:hypothetical protein
MAIYMSNIISFTPPLSNYEIDLLVEDYFYRCIPEYLHITRPIITSVDQISSSTNDINK